MSNYDIIIIGSGSVGATAALALAKSTTLNIAIMDAQPVSQIWQHEKYDHRVSAISLASQCILRNLNVWEKIASKRISPYTQMQVWEEHGKGQINFDCTDVQARALGHIVEDSAIRVSLYEAIRAQPSIHFLYPIKLAALQEKPDQIELTTQDNQIFTAKLIIAADGANSWVREQVGIELKIRDYQQTAIVATVKTELPHQATARQRFLATGPLAFLPLNDPFTSSIVWSTSPEHAETLLKLDDDAFCAALGGAFSHHLGQIRESSVRYHFPLQMRHAKKYVKSRIALIGDAAHTLHPLAGQGVNLGFLDAACLAEVVSDAVDKCRDFASFATLRRYERWRKGDNLAMLGAVDVLKHLFMSEKKSLLVLRELGLGFSNQIPVLKKFFANYALGRRGDLPELAL